MNPNPDVKFRFPFFDIFSSGIVCFFTGAFLYIYFGMTLILGFTDFIGLTLFVLFSAFFIPFILSGVKEFFTNHTSFLLYFKYKKLFSQYTFTSVQDILDATDNTYDDVCEIRSELRELLNKKCISGFKIEYDKVGTFTFRERKHYQNKAKNFPNAEREESSSSQRNSETTSSTTSISSEIARLSSYCNHKILTEEEFQKAKAKLFDAERKGTVPSLSDEVANLTSFRNNGTITEEEFQKAKAKLFES